MDKEMHKKPHKSKKYECLLCNYKTNYKNDYQRHIKSKKHIKNVQINSDYPALKQPYNFKKNTCTICGKEYKFKSGLSRHMKKHLDEETPQKNNREKITINTMQKNDKIPEQSTFSATEVKEMLKTIFKQQEANAKETKFYQKLLQEKDETIKQMKSTH